MRFIIKKIIFVFSLIFIFSFSFDFVFADGTCTCNASNAAVCNSTSKTVTVTQNFCSSRDANHGCVCTDSAATSSTRGTGGLVPCINDCGVSDLLGNASDYANTPPIWTSLLRTALGVSGILILLLFIFGGVQMIISQGDKPKIKKAQEMMKNSVIGLVIVFFAYTLVKFVIIALVDGDNWKIFFGGGN